MRIIGGTLKRRRLRFPRTRATRPVTDRVKETIFNVLGETIRDSLILDLFAGSGSLGMEALSRGAEHVYFIDEAATSTKCVRQNLVELGLLSRGTIYRTSVARGITSLQIRRRKFDLIFLDPPHNKGLIKKTLRLLDCFDILRPHGLIVLGRSNREVPPQDLKTLRFRREIKIGQIFVAFFEKIS